MYPSALQPIHLLHTSFPLSFLLSAPTCCPSASYTFSACCTHLSSSSFLFCQNFEFQALVHHHCSSSVNSYPCLITLYTADGHGDILFNKPLISQKFVVRRAFAFSWTRQPSAVKIPSNNNHSHQRLTPHPQTTSPNQKRRGWQLRVALSSTGGVGFERLAVWIPNRGFLAQGQGYTAVSKRGDTLHSSFRYILVLVLYRRNPSDHCLLPFNFYFPPSTTCLVCNNGGLWW